ncbi:MAG: hypothetical protein JNL60_02720 [Bacteroidia bacterium]|nr:hypothetical protein [Bacteroidia bacterium]
MSRVKTILFWLFVAAALGIGIYAYLELKNNKRPQLNALSVIPDSCLVYLNTSNFADLNTRINERSLIADKLKLFGEINTLFERLQDFDSIINSHENLKKELDKTLVHFAYFENPQSWLFTFNIRQLGEQEDIQNMLAEVLKSTSVKANRFSFKISGKHEYFFALQDGVVLLSDNELLLEKALNSKIQKLENNPSFKGLPGLNENNSCSIFINQDLYAKSKARKRLDLCLGNEHGYSSGSVEILPSQLKINGYASPDSSDLLSTFKDQEAQPCDLLVPVLPNGTIWFKAYGFSSLPRLKEKIKTTEAPNDFWETKNREALFNLRNEFYANTGNHFMELATNTSGAKLVCIDLQDTVKALEHLQQLSDTILTENKPSIFQINNAPGLFLPFSEVDCAYAALWNSHLYFSKSYAELSEVLNELKNGNSMALNESFMLYKNQHFSDDFNFLVYCSPEQYKNRTTYFDFSKEPGERAFENFRHLLLSYSWDKNQFKFRFHLLNESEKRTKQQNVLWTLQLDTISRQTAAGFVNHVNGENEILIQDENNVLYLINAKGTVVWKKKLNEKILSEIYVVDIYKKNKYQMLFSGKRYLHLIDRNGNYVENYPIKLPEEASNTLSVFDYDKDKEYRLFIACENKNIYNYNIHGEKQEKFTIVRTDDAVQLPIQYITVGASDYLVALDKEGKIYTFSRKGLGRIGLRNRTVANCKAFYIDAGNSVSTTRLIYVDDKNGIVNKISFDDKKEISKLVADLENSSVVYSAIDDNRSTDLLLAKGRDIYAFDFSGHLLFEKTSQVDLKSANIFNDESHSVVYALAEGEDQLILFDLQKQNSKTLKASCMPFISNLFNDNKKYLILTQGNKLSCVLLN